MENPLDQREARRLDRQFDLLERRFPRAARPLQALRAPGWWMLRVPVALLLIAGAFLAILPVFGLWMLPLGLLLLAVDVPRLKRPISGAIIRARRRWENRRR